MSNNLVPYIESLNNKQISYLLNILQRVRSDVHAGNMWFLHRDVAVKALNAELNELKKSQSTRISGIMYFDPNKNKVRLFHCLSILEVIEG